MREWRNRAARPAQALGGFGFELPRRELSYPLDYRGVAYRQAAADWLLDLVDGIGAKQVHLVGNDSRGPLTRRRPEAAP